MFKFLSDPIRVFLLILIPVTICIVCCGNTNETKYNVPIYEESYSVEKNINVTHKSGITQCLKVACVEFTIGGHNYMMFLDTNRHYERINVIHSPNCSCHTIYTEDTVF